VLKKQKLNSHKMIYAHIYISLTQLQTAA